MAPVGKDELTAMNAPFESLEERPKTTDNDRAREIPKEVALVTSAEGIAYRYNGRHWEQLTKTQLQRLAFDKLYKGGSARRRPEIADYLKVGSYLPGLSFGRKPSLLYPRLSPRVGQINLRRRDGRVPEVLLQAIDVASGLEPVDREPMVQIVEAEGVR